MIALLFIIGLVSMALTYYVFMWVFVLKPILMVYKWLFTMLFNEIKVLIITNSIVPRVC